MKKNPKVIDLFVGDESTDCHRLFEAFRQKIWLYVLQKVPYQDAEDVFQEICLNIVAKIHKLKDRDKFLPWVFSITRRRIQDYYRFRYQQPPSVGDDQFEFSLLEDASFSQERRLYIAELRQCILQLKDPYREVATLHFIVGLTSPEIACVLELNENTVKSHIIRSRPQVFKCMKRKKI